jgi:aldose 1-epimerase
MATNLRFTGLFKDADARTLVSGRLEAVFLPSHGMLGASLRYRGAEMLGRVEDLEAAAAKGSTAGIPMLYPWANRLAEPSYRVSGQEVLLDLSSPILHLDEHGLPMHGVPWPFLQWFVTEAREDLLAARLEWSANELLAIFPFRHRVDLVARIQPDGLTLETTVVASSDGPVPVSFGFHPYLRLPELARANWLLDLPAMRKLVLDERGIPASGEERFGGFNAPLGNSSFDSGFALIDERASFAVSGAGCRLSVNLLEGYRYMQVFAPKDQDYVALEPMTAPTNALVSGRGLRLLKPNERFRAVFKICIDETPRSIK